MKVITIWQPFAQAIAMGIKRYETRGWATRHRGLIAIHAATRPMPMEFQRLVVQYGMLEPLPRGKIIAICELTDCVPITAEMIAEQAQSELDFGDWRVGRFAWKLKVIRVLDAPIAASGRQGLWNYEVPIRTK